jgi:putative DNA primase/helicase
VVVVPDNDDVGRNHARKVAASLAGVARAVALVELQSLPEKGDISDWLDAGHSADQLLELATAELAKGGPRRADVIRLVDVHKSDVDWLWVGHLARGAITVLDGDPGVGKSLLVAAVAARISTGRALPGGEAHAPATVLLLDAENDHESALKPRVMAAGGDANKVLLYSPPEPDSHVDLDRQEHVDRLEAAVREYGAALLVIDPFVALLGRSVDTFRDQDVRRVLLRLARLAKRCRCAVLLVRHLNKGAGSKAIYRGGGSIGVSAAARVGLLMARDDGDPAVRLLATTKNNLGPEAPTRQVVICSTDGQVPVIEFGKEVSRSADDIVGDEVPEARSARREAMEFLRETLREGARPSKDVVYEARQVGISKGTLLRAAKALGVLHRARAKSGERGMQGWDWELPGDQGDQLPQPSKVSRLITLIPEWEVQAEADEAAPTGSMVADAPPEGLSPAVESEEPAADPSGGSESALCPSCGGDMLYWRDLGYVCRGCKRRLPEPAEEALA